MTSSFDVKRLPPSQVFMFGNKKKSQGARSRELGDAALPCSPIQWAGALSWWKYTFSAENKAISPSIRHRINRCSIAQLSSFLSPNSRWRFCFGNPKKRWPWPFRPMGQSLPSSEQNRLEKSTVSTAAWYQDRSSGSIFRSRSRIGEKNRWITLQKG